jgi:hypothetical protein
LQNLGTPPLKGQNRVALSLVTIENIDRFGSYFAAKPKGIASIRARQFNVLLVEYSCEVCANISQVTYLHITEKRMEYSDQYIFKFMTST